MQKVQAGPTYSGLLHPCPCSSSVLQPPLRLSLLCSTAHCLHMPELVHALSLLLLPLLQYKQIKPYLQTSTPPP